MTAEVTGVRWRLSSLQARTDRYWTLHLWSWRAEREGEKESNQRRMNITCID